MTRPDYTMMELNPQKPFGGGQHYHTPQMQYYPGQGYNPYQAPPMYRDYSMDPRMIAFMQQQQAQAPKQRENSGINSKALGKAINSGIDYLFGPSTVGGTVPTAEGMANIGGSLYATTGAAPAGTANVGGSLYTTGLVDGAAMEGMAANVAGQGGTAGTSAVGSGTPLFDVGAPSYAGYLAAAMGAYNNIKNWDDVPEEMRGTKAQQNIALAVADVYTGGLASAAEAFARSQWGGTMAKLDKIDAKYNPMSRLITSMQSYKHKREQNARKRLVDKGYAGWAELDATLPQLKSGRSIDEMQRKDLADDFVGKDSEGTWVNNKFNQSRDVNDLRAEDIWGYSAFGNKFGNDWLGKFSEGDRRSIAQAYLDNALVSERTGQIHLGENDAINKFLQENGYAGLS